MTATNVPSRTAESELDKLTLSSGWGLTLLGFLGSFFAFALPNMAGERVVTTELMGANKRIFAGTAALLLRSLLLTISLSGSPISTLLPPPPLSHTHNRHTHLLRFTYLNTLKNITSPAGLTVPWSLLKSDRYEVWMTLLKMQACPRLYLPCTVNHSQIVYYLTRAPCLQECLDGQCAPVSDDIA